MPLTLQQQLALDDMDMPEDSPPRPNYPHDPSSASNDRSEEQFSSFASSDSSDADGGTNLGGFKEQPIALPSLPENVKRLYEIYMKNVEKKKRLKQQIERLISKKLLSIRAAYDKSKCLDWELIDIDEVSKDYISSKKNYDKRLEELGRLEQTYQDYKIMEVENYIMNDSLMQEMLKHHIEKNKHIVAIDVCLNAVTVLCRERIRHKKLGKMKGNVAKQKEARSSRSKASNTDEELDDSFIDKEITPSKSKDSTKYEHQAEQKVSFKYVFRTFTFYNTEHGVSFKPLSHVKELPGGREYLGFTTQASRNLQIVYDEAGLYFLSYAGGAYKIEHKVQLDKRPKFCRAKGSLLYIATQDDIMRVYSIKQPFKPELKKIALCLYLAPARITHYALTPNPDVILFVKESSILCELNLGTYSCVVRNQLSSPVVFLSEELIITQNEYYTNYWPPANKSSLNLNPNQRLKEFCRDRKLVRLHHHEAKQFIVFQHDSGEFCVQLWT